MILRGVAKRYAVALFDASVKHEIAEQVNGDLASFNKIYAENARFRNFMESPQVLTEDKRELLTSALSERASGLFVRFLLLLIEKKRLEHIDEIADAYRHLYEQLKGIVEVKAITAVPLEGDLEHKTRETLEQKTGKEIRLVKITDPSVIGGMVLIIEDRIIDGSIRHQLDDMRKTLSELKVH